VIALRVVRAAEPDERARGLDAIGAVVKLLGDRQRVDRPRAASGSARSSQRLASS
jgi:hypothetical protein